MGDGRGTRPGRAGLRVPKVPVVRGLKPFLTALEESGNVTFAAARAGANRGGLYERRKADPDFAAEWDSALAEFRALAEAAAADGSADEGLAAKSLVLRRGRGRALQIVTARANQWTAAKDDAFFAHFEATLNAAAAAKAAGFSAKAAWARLRACPRFRERWDQVVETGKDALEVMLLEEGTNALAGRPAADGSGPTEKPDPNVAMWLLKRDDQRRAGTLRRGGRRRGLPERTVKEAVDSILAKIDAIERHEARIKALGQGVDGEGI